MDHWFVELPPSLGTGQVLGRGCYGVVVPHSKYPDEWIIKKAKNDGTRTYLEWCHFMQHKKKRRLRGMPEIDWIVAQGRHMYVVCMRRYRPLWTGKESKNDNLAILKAAGWCDGFVDYDLHKAAGCPGYLLRLIKSFEKLYPDAVNDFHRGNLMYDKVRNELILTDPSSFHYRPLPTQPTSAEPIYVCNKPVIPELTLE